MSWGDVRGLLQYVPQFRGKVFVIVVDAPLATLAETMLDLVSLQDIGVNLVLGSTLHNQDDLLDRAAEVELNVQQIESLDGTADILSALGRGQAVVADFSSLGNLSSELAEFANLVSAKKLILLHNQEADIPVGAIRAAEIDAAQSTLLGAAASACHAGVPRVHLLNGSCPGVLLSELFSNEGVGTMVYADSYRKIRPLREEDIVELLGMIGRSVRNAHLVPRDYAAVADRMDAYSVMEIDGNVVGSVALYHYPEAGMAEVACLYVKQAHEGLGYATELVRYAEQRAKSENIPQVFALTNRAAGFFQQQGYQEMSMDKMPDSRREQLIASGRNSGLYGKCL